MDRAIIEQNVRLIANIDKAPGKVVQLAESFNLQSSTSIPLKPNQEPARIHICSVLAVEKLGEQLQLTAPDIKKPPIPPAQYKKLLNQFRSVLAPETQAPEPQSRTPSTPKRRTASPRPRTTDTPSPQRSVRSSRRKAVDFLKDELDADGVDDDDDTDFQSLALDRDDEDLKGTNEFSTPRKRPPVGPARGSPSPRKSPRKGSAAPTLAKISQLAERTSLEESTTAAVIQAYNQYAELVKDAWGLLYGLFVVIADRAEPRQGNEHERKLALAMGQLFPEVAIDRDEWVGWVEKIVTGQTWITNISKRPETQPNLVGAPGGWGLGVEFTLV